MRPSTDKPTGGTADDPFRYGWREVYHTRPDGSFSVETIPLTLDDVLYPLEGDHIVHNTEHARDCHYLYSVFNSRSFGPAVTGVTHDLGIVFGVKPYGRPSPDIAVLTGLSRPLPKLGELRLPEWGGRCELIVEVVSPSTRENDVVTKLEMYHAFGVRMYVIVDQEEEDGPRKICAYRYAPDAWVPVATDAMGQVELPLVGLRLAIGPDRVVCYDTGTGQELGDYNAVTRALEEADRRAEQQNQAIEEQILARQQAERLAEQQAQALQKVDRLAEQQAQALRGVERLAGEQAQALQEADRLAELQRQAADKAQQRIKELEALVQRLQAGGPADAPTA